MRIFSGIQPTGDKTIGNLIGGFRQYAATQERGEGFFCIVDLHSISVDYDPEDFREKTLDLAAMLFATGLDPERVHRLRAEPRARARRGGLAARRGHGLRPAQPDDAVQGQVRRTRLRLCRALHLSGADGRRHPALPDRHRPDRRRPAAASGARARRGRALQLALRRDLQDPRGRLSRSRSADHGPAGADEEDVDDVGDAAGDGSDPRRRRRDPEEVQVCGDRLGLGGPARRKTSRASRT